MQLSLLQLISGKRLKQEPTSVSEALSSPEKEEWKKAMNSEMESISDNKVWELVELPEEKRVVGSKARLVAQGFSQCFGVDYARHSALFYTLSLFLHWLQQLSRKV